MRQRMTHTAILGFGSAFKQVADCCSMPLLDRTIAHDGNHVADIYVALELKPLIDERNVLRQELLAATILAGLGAALVGFLIVRRMVAPVRVLASHLQRRGWRLHARSNSAVTSPCAM